MPEKLADYRVTFDTPINRVSHSFNLPRISARLERLMGTNVVKLTDRAYMKELRERIDEDYRKQLLARIRAREVSPQNKNRENAKQINAFMFD